MRMNLVVLTKKLIEALTIRLPGSVFIAQPPLAETAGAIARCFQLLAPPGVFQRIGV